MHDCRVRTQILDRMSGVYAVYANSLSSHLFLPVPVLSLLIALHEAVCMSIKILPPTPLTILRKLGWLLHKTLCKFPSSCPTEMYAWVWSTSMRLSMEWGVGEDDDDVDRIFKPTESSEPPTLTFLNHCVTHVKWKFWDLTLSLFEILGRTFWGG